MEIQVAEARPPYVKFEYRAVEDRDASITAGHFVTKDLAYAIITPQGSKDQIERIVDEWFAALEQQVQEERFPQNWLQAFKGSFENWKNDREDPVSGTSVRNWSVLSPSQVTMLLNFHVKTVEDLAAANEELISRLGMGGRSLVEKAKLFMNQATDSGKVVEQMSALRVKNEELSEQNKALIDQLAALTAEVKAISANQGKKSL